MKFQSQSANRVIETIGFGLSCGETQRAPISGVGLRHDTAVTETREAESDQNKNKSNGHHTATGTQFTLLKWALAI